MHQSTVHPDSPTGLGTTLTILIIAAWQQATAQTHIDQKRFAMIHDRGVTTYTGFVLALICVVQ